MRFLGAIFFTAFLSVAVGGGKIKKLREEIEVLESAFSTVLEDTEEAIDNLTNCVQCDMA